MTQITIQEIERDPLAFVHRIEAGEPLLVLRGGVAIAEVQPVSTTTNQPRPFGLASGEFALPDDFDGPLPDEIISLFDGA
jgi:antitoxin (DNA-binding transcriptional repressor) of toxin-antitoxin stability system